MSNANQNPPNNPSGRESDPQSSEPYREDRPSGPPHVSSGGADSARTSQPFRDDELRGQTPGHVPPSSPQFPYPEGSAGTPIAGAFDPEHDRSYQTDRLQPNRDRNALRGQPRDDRGVVTVDPAHPNDPLRPNDLVRSPYDGVERSLTAAQRDRITAADRNPNLTAEERAAIYRDNTARPNDADDRNTAATDARRNPQDATMRNINPLKAQISALTDRISVLEKAFAALRVDRVKPASNLPVVTPASPVGTTRVVTSGDGVVG